MQVPPDAVAAVNSGRGGADGRLDSVDVIEPITVRRRAGEPIDRLHEAAAIPGLHAEAPLEQPHHRLGARDAFVDDRPDGLAPEVPRDDEAHVTRARTGPEAAAVDDGYGP